MGLDLKRSDTPKFVQDFLHELLKTVLDGGDRLTVIDKIKNFKNILKDRPSWEKGSPKSVKKLTVLEQQMTKSKDQKFGYRNTKINMPGHTRASINWNYLRELNGDNYSMRITDGMKIIVCKLRTNQLGMTSIAYPVDELRLPEWFKTLPFDDAEMERTLVDEKVENLFSVLNWELRENTDVRSTFSTLFSFE